MDQPVDEGGSQGGISIQNQSPFFEDAIRRQDERTGFIAGGDDLEQQIGSAFIDGQVTQPGAAGPDICKPSGSGSSVRLGAGEFVKQVDDPREADGEPQPAGGVSEGD